MFGLFGYVEGGECCIFCLLLGKEFGIGWIGVWIVVFDIIYV